jgi:NlpC/P60 family putative phage cell wall peptidase
MQAQKIVTLARSWIGTPYHNMAAAKGHGCDCLGLLRGVYAEAYGNLVETPNYKGRPPRKSTGRETMLEAARNYLVEAPIETRGPGIVLVFRTHPKLVAWHCGIMTNKTDMVHSHSGRKVYEVTLGKRWEPRVVAAFRFPEIKD